MNLIRKCIHSINNQLKKRKWMHAHPDSNLVLKTCLHPENITAGIGSYGELNVLDTGGEARLKIGNYVSVGEDVTFLLNVEHPVDRISTFPFKVETLHTSRNEAFSKGDIIVDDDAWIGHGATILSNVHIGQGAVIAAGAVVTHYVPPYAIVGGVPAKVIRYRFDDELIKTLLEVDYSKLSKDLISQHIDELYESLRNIDQISWMPRK